MNRASVAQQADTLSRLPPTQGILQRKCACGNKTAASSECTECAKKKDGLQRKLSIGVSNDPLEREADHVAEQVIRMREPLTPDQPATKKKALAQATPSLTPDERPCAAPERAGGERFPLNSAASLATGPASAHRPAAIHVQRMHPRSGGSEPALHSGVSASIQSVRGGGSALSRGVRGFFEPRFGADFTGVRVHTGDRAAALASSVNARAFTVGRDVVFGAGEYRPGTDVGRSLIAHELTHTLQQKGGEGRLTHDGQANTVRRLVHPTRSNCPPSVHGAPADPIAQLQSRDAEAQRMALGASNVLFLESLVRDDPTFGPSVVSTAYLHRFGAPEQLGNGKFRTRFTGSTNYDTNNQAISAGMRGLASRFDRLAGLFKENIDYDCPGTTRFTLRGCTPSSCDTSDGATTCPTGLRAIKICPGFWNTMSAPQRAGALIHEASHIVYRMRNHNAGSARQRRLNPECYTSFLADIEPFNVWDGRCPRTAP